MDCTQCKAILNGGVAKRCRKCINEKHLSIKEVMGNYPGWLMVEIIEARSHKGAEDGVGTDMDGGVSCSGCDSTACSGVPTATAEVGGE